MTKKHMFEIDYIDKEKVIDALSSLMDGLTEEIQVKEYEQGSKTQISGNVNGSVGHEILGKAGGKIEGTHTLPENSNELTFTTRETDGSLLRKLFTRMETIINNDPLDSKTNFCELEGDLILSPFQEAMQSLAPLQDTLIESAKDGKTNTNAFQKMLPLIFDEKDIYLLMKNAKMTYVIRANRKNLRDEEYTRLCGNHKILCRIIKRSKEGDAQGIYSPKLNIASIKSFDIKSFLPLLAQMGHEISEADLKVSHPFVLVQAYAIYQRTEV